MVCWVMHMKMVIIRSGHGRGRWLYLSSSWREPSTMVNSPARKASKDPKVINRKGMRHIDDLLSH